MSPYLGNVVPLDVDDAVQSHVARKGDGEIVPVHRKEGMEAT